MRSALAAAALAVAACEPAPPPPRAPNAPAEVAQRPTSFATDEATWGKFHSKRFRLVLPLPDGRAWRIDDHGKPDLTATHEPTRSRLRLLATKEEELVNREKCEARARERGWVPKDVSTLEDAVTVGPEAYDSRVWVALSAPKAGGALTGHVFLFGAFIRSCLLVHIATEVPSAADEDVLSARLAIARARLVGGITLDPPRVGDDGAVPRERSERPR